MITTSPDLDITNLIEKAQDIFNNDQLGKAAEIAYPVQNKMVGKTLYQLKLIMTSVPDDIFDPNRSRGESWTPYLGDD